MQNAKNSVICTCTVESLTEPTMMKSLNCYNFVKKNHTTFTQLVSFWSKKPLLLQSWISFFFRNDITWCSGWESESVFFLENCKNSNVSGNNETMKQW